MVARLHVGKIAPKGVVHPWEPHYYSHIKAQVGSLNRIIDSIMEQFGDVTPQICMEALKPTFEKAKRYTPLKSGELRDSGYLEVVTKSRTRPRVEMGFAKGGKPDYAVLIHEDLTRYHAPPTQAKFLQRAVEEDLVSIALNIGKLYRKFLNG